MKTIFRITTMVAVMFITITGMANEVKFSLAANGDTKSLVFKLQPNEGETTIKFEDGDGNLIYSEKVSATSNFAKKFDLENLKDGTYFFMAENVQRVVTYSVSIKGTGIEIIAKEEDVKPFFRKKGAMLYLNLLNPDKETVEIRVYDSSDRLIFEERIENEFLVEKAFNFEKAFADNYTIMVKDNNNTYYEDVVIR